MKISESVQKEVLDIKAEFRMYEDGDDPWGDNFCNFFAVCDVLTDRGIMPNNIDFEQSICGSEKNDRYKLFNDFSDDALLYLVQIMNRYDDRLRKAGKNY